MINSVLGLISSVCLFSKVKTFKSYIISNNDGKPCPRKHKLNVLRGSREEVNKELPPCTAAWMGSKTFPGRRQSGEMQTRSFRADLVLSCCFHWHNTQAQTCDFSPGCLYEMPFGCLLPAEHGELSHVPLGHPDLPRETCPSLFIGRHRSES